jgi:hypothetical protein
VDERQADFAQFDRLNNQWRKLILRDTHYAFPPVSCQLAIYY